MIPVVFGPSAYLLTECKSVSTCISDQFYFSVHILLLGVLLFVLDILGEIHSVFA